MVEKIRDIVTSRMPYGRIKDLPGLYQQFIEIYSRILDEKLEPVKEIIDSDRQTALNALEGQTFEDVYKPKVLQAFSDLTERAERQNDISDMLGFKDKADSLLKTYLDQFAKLLAAQPKTPPAGGDTPKDGSSGHQDGDTQPASVHEPQATYHTRNVKNLMIGDLTSRTWVIRDRKSLEDYLDKIRQRIEKELDNDTDVYIHF